VQANISTFTKIKNKTQGLEQLQSDLESGRWAEINAELMLKTELDVGYRIITARC